MMPHWLSASIPYLTSVIAIAASLVASGHAVLRKREVRAAIGWVGVIWLVPLFGALLYLVLGINRVRRQAVALRAQSTRYLLPRQVSAIEASALPGLMESDAAHLAEIARVLDRTTPRPLLPGNRFTLLVDGDGTYPAMLDAIAAAQSTITLSTYIFDNDPVGREFVEALGAAVRRGVEVRVLLDDAGARYSQPPIDRRLRKRGVRVARFMPAWQPRWTMHFNLRNHRKIMVIDGRTGFTGGINIRRGHVLTDKPPHAVRDIHFAVEGPVVAHLQEIFAEDWEFTTREALTGERFFPALEPVGSMLARAVADGPDEDMDKIRWAFHAAIATARHSIRIVTPYFLPDLSITTALNVAAMRGVAVDVLLPERSNLPVVGWAMRAHLDQLLGHGCRVLLTPPPFDHAKLLLVDDHWSFIGSANWDPRSLRLNFECNIECYDATLARRLSACVDERALSARELTREELEARSLPIRLRDGIARLFTPYL